MKENVTYQQPEKNEVRRKSLRHAVDLLTKRRNNAAVVPKKHVKNVREFLISRNTLEDKRIASICNDQLCLEWESLWESKVSAKSPEDLVVAYLAGPDPLNDFNELVNLGVHPHNIFAFESENKIFNKALKSIKESSFPLLKLIPIKIEAYIQSVPTLFDIIYFDACGTFPSRDQNTVRVISSIFRYQRLAPLGVLITNFSSPDIEKEDQLNLYSEIVSTYLHPKGFLESKDPEWNCKDGAFPYGFYPNSETVDESFFHEVKNDFSFYYSQYITRQIFDIASFITPITRLANSEMWKSLFKKDAKQIAKLAFSCKYENDEYGNVGELITDPEMYAIGWALTAFCDNKDEDYNYPIMSDKSRKLRNSLCNQLEGSPSYRIKVMESIDSYLFLRSSLPKNKDIIQEALHNLLEGYKYMQKMYMFCDVPSDELTLFPILAQYAYPMHYNTEETKRYTYTASGKKTKMYTDVIPFDSCRYIYDWLPSTELVDSSFELLSHQLIYRFALDGIAKHTKSYNDEYLFGTHIVGVNNEGFHEKILTPRVNIQLG